MVPMGSPMDHFHLVGFTVAEKYLVEDVVGESGYALTYRAVEVATNTVVAVQVFKVLGEYDADTRKRLLQAFMQQGTTLKELTTHAPAIRTPRDVGPLITRDGKWVPFSVFDWLRGTSLRHILVAERDRGAGVYNLPSVMSLLEPIAAALELVHSRDLAHLDVKPSNVFVAAPTNGGTKPTIHLLDFGTAHLVSHAFDWGGGEGAVSFAPSYFAPAYAAPEQFNGSTVGGGPWTDVFALAVMLTEMVTGKAADEGDPASQTTSARPTPRMLGAQVDDAVEAVFARALALDPRRRYQSAGEFWNAARTAVGKEPIAWEARPPEDRAPTSVPSSRRLSLQPAAEPVALPLPPPRARVDTSPDLVRQRLDAEEGQHRSPRLLILSVTLLLVGIAIGVMCAHPKAGHQQPEQQDRGTGTTHGR